MSLELSTPVKIIALVGLLLVCAAAGLFLLARNHSTPTTATVPVTPTHVRTHPATTHHPVSLASTFVSGLPTPLVRALTRSKTVVAVVWAEGDPVASDTLKQARLGAHVAHAPLVVLDVANNTVAGQTASWMNNDIVEPAVLVVTRPGTVAVELPGYTDEMAVAQAVVDSRP
jgi:hypothetical protein